MKEISQEEYIQAFSDLSIIYDNFSERTKKILNRGLQTIVPDGLLSFSNVDYDMEIKDKFIKYLPEKDSYLLL